VVYAEAGGAAAILIILDFCSMRLST